MCVAPFAAEHRMELTALAERERERENGGERQGEKNNNFFAAPQFSESALPNVEKRMEEAQDWPWAWSCDPVRPAHWPFRPGPTLTS